MALRWGFLLLISKACQALSASACWTTSPPLPGKDFSSRPSGITSGGETHEKKQSGCDLSAEPMTELPTLLRPPFNQRPRHSESGHLLSHCVSIVACSI